jgi:hypothetical protein
VSDLIATTPAAVCELWLTRVRDALVACSSAPIRDSYVAAGTIAWDDCCGVLVVGPERIYRSATFPIEGQTDDQCEFGFLVVDLVVLLMRCVPTIDDRGNPPTPAVMDAAYKAVMFDGAVIWNTVTDSLPQGWERANVDQTYIGASGGCIAIETRMSIGLPQAEWCPECN